jgi:hypothetical protein
MAENELDNFENLDDLFGEEKQGGEAAAAAGGDLDQLLGDKPAEGAGEAGAASDTELDSFFEDLSTIDDLEVAREEAPPAAPPKIEPQAGLRAEEPAPRRATPAKPKKKGGMLRRALILLVLLGVAAGAAYWFFLPSEQVPWEVSAPEEKTEQPVKEEAPPPPPPQPLVAKPAPPPQPAPPPAPRATFSIQVATCFFPSCVQEFQKRLKEVKIPSRVREKAQSRETLEIYSATTFDARDMAQQMADKINRENRMEGQAFVIEEGNGFKVSLGHFTDLGRANIVRDALNQRMTGEVNFTTRIKGIPYKLHYVLGGNYGSQTAAEAARKKLLASDSRFADSFVVRN